MSLEDFKNKYLGKQVEYHSFGSGALNQCVDLINQYITEVLGLTHIIGTNAKDFKDRYKAEDFEWISNSPLGVPQKGDIVVWNGRVGGGAGHVGIFLDGDVNSFRSLDQNWSQTERVTLETHNYNNVSGWLRPKKQPDDQQAIIDRLRKERDDNWNLYQETLNQVTGLKEEKKQLEDFRKQLARKLATDDQPSAILGAVEQLVGCEDRFNSLQRDFDKVKVDKESLETENSKLKQEVGSMGIRIIDLEKQIEGFSGIAEAKEKATEALEKCINRQPYCSRLGRWLKLCN